MKPIILLAFSLFAFPAYAQEEKPPQCVPAEMALAQIDEATPVVRHVVLKQDQALRVVAWYSQIPPESHETWNYVVLFQTTRGLGLLMGRDDKVCYGFRVRRDQVKGLLDAIAGGEDT